MTYDYSWEVWDNVEKCNIIKKINSGYSNNLYLINSKYIWKHYLSDTYYQELDIIKKLPYYNVIFTINNHCCYKFIKGTTINIKYFKENMSLIMNLTSKVHQIHLDNNLLSWNDIIDKMLLKIIKHKLYQNILEKYETINNNLNTISSKDDLVLCHNDIHPDNILNNNKKLYLIDWEMASSNYYFYDLANIICEMYCDYQNNEYKYEKIDDKIIIQITNMYNNHLIEKKNIVEKIKLGIKMSHLL